MTKIADQFSLAGFRCGWSHEQIFSIFVRPGLTFRLRITIANRSFYLFSQSHNQELDQLLTVASSEECVDWFEMQIELGKNLTSDEWYITLSTVVI